MAKRELPRGGGQKQNTFFGGAAILAVGILVVILSGDLGAMAQSGPFLWIAALSGVSTAVLVMASVSV